MALVNDIGKTIASIRRGSVVYNFFNATIVESTNVNFVDEVVKKDGTSSVRYVFNASNTAGYNYRALHYTRSYTDDALDLSVHPVLYVSSYGSYDTHYGVPAVPLYEAIAPSICKYGDGIYQLSWWSNTNGVLTPDSNDSTNYTYDSSKIMKFSTTSLGDVQQNANCSKILCTASISWERLKQTNGTAVDTAYWDVPVIEHVTILQCINGLGYVTDFSTGGGKSGIGMHSHIDNNNGGLAVATFAPSAMMRPISWS